MFGSGCAAGGGGGGLLSIIGSLRTGRALTIQNALVQADDKPSNEQLGRRFPRDLAALRDQFSAQNLSARSEIPGSLNLSP